MMKQLFIKKLNPAVDKRCLMFIAGLMWCGVAVLLLRYSIIWLSTFSFREMLFYGISGIVLALPVYYWGFLRLADKNLIRLKALTEKSCIFSFITWKSYLIIPIMVTFGILLRHSSLPLKLLSLIYTILGFSLFFSGLHYFIFLFKSKRKEA